MRIVDEYVALRALVGDWPVEIPADLLGLTYNASLAVALGHGGAGRWTDQPSLVPDQTAQQLLDRVAEIVPPLRPGPDLSHGIDLGL